MQSVNRDPFPPMAFPYLIMGLMGLTLVGLAIGAIRNRNKPASPIENAEDSQSIASEQEGIGQPTSRQWWQLAMVAGAITVYPLFVDQLGFVLTIGVSLLLLLIGLGTRPLRAAVVVVVFTPLVYQIFAHGLRVPLPRGLLGW
jgi:hypothetical protein